MNFLVSFRKRNYVFATQEEAVNFINHIFNKTKIMLYVTYTDKKVNRIYKF